MYSTYKLNKQGDSIQLWYTPFPIWNQSVVPCLVLTVVSCLAYGFLRRQVRWSGTPICLRIFHSLFWSTQCVWHLLYSVICWTFRLFLNLGHCEYMIYLSLSLNNVLYASLTALSCLCCITYDFLWRLNVQFIEVSSKLSAWSREGAKEMIRDSNKEHAEKWALLSPWASLVRESSTRPLGTEGVLAASVSGVQRYDTDVFMT